MALADRVASASLRPKEAVRADPVTMEEFGVLLGRGTGTSVRTKSGATVGAHRALGITAWYSGVRYLSESIAGLPWHTYRKVGESRERRASPPWLRKPDTEMAWYGFVEHVVMSLLHKGNAYAFKIRNSVDQVVGLRGIHPDRVTVGVGPDGTKRFLVDCIETRFTSREVLHIPGLSYDGRVGLNPIATFADALGTVAAADDFAASWFGNNTHIGGIISVPQDLTGPQAQDLRQEWDKFHQGLLNAHKTGVLSKGATYNRITLSASDAQMIESREYGVTEVARMLRIPPHKLYDLTRATFSNIEHQSIEAITDSVQPIVERIEAWMNFDPNLLTTPNTYLEATLEGRLRGDSNARATFYNLGITGGWMMPSTAAAKENLEAPEELDYYMRPLNMAVLRPGQPEQITDPQGAAQ